MCWVLVLLLVRPVTTGLVSYVLADDDEDYFVAFAGLLPSP